MTTDLLARARAGGADAFRELVEPHRCELEVHCYRILGSADDAEDALQESLLAAWRGLGGFQERASVRTWLCRIATTRSVNAPRQPCPAETLSLPGRRISPRRRTSGTGHVLLSRSI